MAEDVAGRESESYFAVAQSLTEAGLTEKSKVAGIWVPGRIEVLGKHTDYAGGHSLLVASEYGFAVIVCPLKVQRYCLLNAVFNESLELNAEGNIVDRSCAWAHYPATSVRRIRSNFGPLSRGAFMGFQSSLPQAAGMSSSSAFIVATVLALLKVSQFQFTERYRRQIQSPIDFADYLGHVENGQSYKDLEGDAGVGTFGGSQDHTAILCARRNQILHAGFKPTRVFDYRTMPAGHTFCIANSGVRAEKTANAKLQYNQASFRARQVLEKWNTKANKHADSLAEIIEHPEFDKDVFVQMLQADDIVLADRFKQFYREVCVHIPNFISSIENSEMGKLGQVTDASQWDASRMLYNQVPETDFLVSSARAHGAVAASAFGAGFGGSVWAIVSDQQMPVFQQKWLQGYIASFPEHTEAAVFSDVTGPAAFTF